jgi:hypothetical protein
VVLTRKRPALFIGIQVQAGHCLPKVIEIQVWKVSFGAVCDEHSRRHELPQEKHPAPDEAHGHNRVGFWSLAWIERPHLDHGPGFDLEIEEDIRQNPKHPSILEGMFFLRGVDFQKIGSEAMVDLRGWRSL